MARGWSHDARAALDPAARGLLRVRGGPGTGKSSLLIDAAAAHIAAGVEPQSVLLLTGAGRVDTRVRGALTTALLAVASRAGAELPVTIREPLIRTVHSYAFAVLRLAAQRAGDPPPRLVTGAEQDGVVRELLDGDRVDAWPPPLRAALSSTGFATELRNLLARCAERGVSPAQLAALGRRCDRPEWTAAGRFAQQYEQVMLLRAAAGRAAPQATVPALGAAELVGAALDAFAADPGLLTDEHARLRLLLVDDAQQLDPQAARLVAALAAGAERIVVADDPGQAVFGFRGADAAALVTGPRTAGVDIPTVTLTASHRCAPAVARAINGVAGRLAGTDVVRQFDGTGVDEGSVTTLLAASSHAEADLIADTLRRAHLMDGVPWSQMAVIVRSVRRVAGRLPRALEAAGVPVTMPGPASPLAEHPAVAALLTVLTATVDGLDGPRALTLLTGPIGRVDPISLRQLWRALRRGGTRPRMPTVGEMAPVDMGEQLAAALSGEPGAWPAAHAGPLRRVRAVLQAADRCHRAGQDPHSVLWQAWCRSGLQRRWLHLSERGGSAGAQASRDLDAVTALFDVAEQYVSRTGGASLGGLVEHVTAMQLAAPRIESPSGLDAVSLLSAHAALGQQWDLVVIAGLQDGLWPNTVPRGGVLHTQRLIDTLDGVGEGASARALLLAEERRLLVAAMGRARRRLVVTAVDGDGDTAGATPDEIPSRFFTELTPFDTGDGHRDRTTKLASPRVLSAAAVVGRLRAAVCAPAGTVDDADRADAATQLARLARAGVPGADPAGWYGMQPVSTDAPLPRADDEQPVTLSPSSVQTLLDCPLRWMAERHGATDGSDLRSTVGSMLHALIADPAKTEAELLAGLDRVWQQLPFEARWFSANERARYRAMLQTFVQWRDQTRDRLTEVGVEVELDGVIDGVRLRGRVDRVERDNAGRLVVVDVKTGKTPVSKDDAQRHAQLATYQLAVEAGLVQPGGKPGGGRLVYPGKPAATGATEREQDPLTAEARDTWRDMIAQAAAAGAGPRFIARVNDGCRHCPVRPICPAYAEGADR